MMQLGFVSAILPDQNLEEVFKIASSIGYECVEVMCWPPGKSTRRYAGITHIDVTSLEAEAVEKIRNLQEQYGVAISGLGYYPNALSPDQQEAETATAHIKTVITATAQLGLNRMNTFIGRDWTKSIDDNWPRFVETWTPIIRHAEANNVKVGLKTARCFSPQTNGQAAKTSQSAPQFGNGCLMTFRAITLGSTTIHLT